MPKREWWRLASARIAIGFVVWSALWVILSDYCLYRMVKGAPQAIWTIETIKGLVYVAITGVLLFLFIRAREKEYYAARRTAENRLRRACESNLISICYWKPTGEITDANDAFLNLIGYTRQELLDRKLNWHSFTPPEYFGSDSEHLKRLLATGGHAKYEKEFLRKDHTRIPVLVGASMLDASNLRGIAYVLDMSELKQAQQRSLELEQQLRQSQKLEAVGQLASGIAHDFNSLLNIIIGYTCLIDAKVHDNEVLSQEAKHILKAAEKASGLIRKLLAFGRKQLLHPELVDINSTLREYQHILPRIVGEKIRLELKPRPGLWLVEVDRNQLEQVIINLAVNARDAMPYGGVLTIQTANDQQSDCVLVAVSDTGIGMTPETKARMFDPFFTTKPEGQSSGLGLSTVYGIVAQSGGRISVSSELGRGTTFNIFLPRALRSTVRPHLPKGPSRENLAVLPKKTHETILLAEDEADLRELLTILLRTHGYRVITAKNGEEAVLLAKKNSGKIELLLTDIVMPRMNGIEASHQIRSFLPDVSVLYMTGYAEEAHSMQKPEENVALLEKPVSPPILIDKIRELLDARMNRRSA